MRARDGEAAAYGFRITARVGIAAAVACLAFGQDSEWARFGILAWPLSDASIALRVVFDVLTAGAVLAACCATVTGGRVRAIFVAGTTGLAFGAGIMIPDLVRSSVSDIETELVQFASGPWLAVAGLVLLLMSTAAATISPTSRSCSTDRPIGTISGPADGPALRPAVPRQSIETPQS